MWCETVWKCSQCCLKIKIPLLFLCVSSSLCLSLLRHRQPPHSGRIEHSQNILQQQHQHGSGVHGNQSLGDAGSPLPQRNSNTQNSRLQSDGSFGLGGPGAPGGEGADHALDVSANLLIMCSVR